MNYINFYHFSKQYKNKNMGSSQEKHRHEEALRNLKNIEDDNRRKRETERYIAENKKLKDL